MSYTPPLNGGRINMTISGNTAGVGSLASTGTVTLAGGNNITLSQNGNAITISGANGGGAAGTNTLGMSNLGNTSGTTGVITGSNLQMALAGGNNVTLSQSINASSATITVSAANQSVQTQSNVAGIYDGANSISTGTVRFSNSNGVSFGINGQTITASHNGITSQTNQNVSLYALGNTTQNSSTLLNASNLSFNGLGEVTMGFSNGSIQVSAPTQTVQTQSRFNLTLAGNSTSAGAGYAQISSGTMTLAGGNNVTLSQNGNAVTVSAANQSNQSVGLYAVSNTTQSTSATVDARSLSFAGAGIASVGASNGSVVVSVPAGGGAAGTNTLGMSNLGNTSGTTGVITGSNLQLAFAGGNNVTLSQSINASSATITISAGNGGGNTTYETFWFPYNEAVNVVGQVGQGSLGFAPVPTPAVGDQVQVDRVVMPLYFTNASNSTGSLTVSFWMGLYTRTDSSISLVHSTSATASLGFAGNNSSANQRGIRLFSFGWTTTITNARYFVGIVSRSTTAGTNASLSQVQVSQLNSNLSGLWDVASNATVQWPLGIGFYSATTSGMPDSVAFSQIRGTNSLAARMPSWHMISGTV